MKANGQLVLQDRYIRTPGSDYAGGMVENIRRGFDRGMYRPFIDDDDKACVIVNTGRWTKADSKGGERRPISQKHRINDILNDRVPGFPARTFPLWLLNATSLRRDDWVELDRRVQMAYRAELTAWEDLLRTSSYGGFNAWGKMTIEYEAMSDPGIAVVDMDGLTDAATNDTPLFKNRSMPLPVTHSDFWEADRTDEVSANSGVRVSTRKAEAAARRIAEMVEKTVIGVSGGFSGLAYGGRTTGQFAHDTATYTAALGASTVYGYTTFPMRLTKTNMTAPTTTNGPTTYNEVLAALVQLQNIYAKGPFMLYHSTDWSPYMDTPFSTAGGNHPGETLRTMLAKIPNIAGVKRLDLLTSTYTLIFVSLKSNVAEAVNGMDVTTLQWESAGGLRKNWKVMVIQVPRLYGDYSGNTGILVATTA